MKQQIQELAKELAKIADESSGHERGARFEVCVEGWLAWYSKEIRSAKV